MAATLKISEKKNLPEETLGTGQREEKSPEACGRVECIYNKAGRSARTHFSSSGLYP